jgi:hypothetical protein
MMEKFHAVVYVHGMGSQRRHQELSTLVHACHQYSGTLDRDAGRLTRAEAHNEPFRGNETLSGNEPEIAYLKTIKQSDTTSSEHRFYEVYWAPITAGGTSALEVLRWIFPQSLNALRVIRAKFADFGRLRRVFLHRMYALEDNQQQCKPDYDELLARYEAFCYPKDDALQNASDDFLGFLKKSNYESPEREADVQSLATRWFKLQQRGFREDFVLLLLTTLLVFQALLVLLITLLAASLMLGTTVIGGLFKAFRLDQIVEFLQSSLEHTTALVITRKVIEATGPQAAVYVAIGVVLFVLWLLWQGQIVLRDFLGDVQQWTTFTETDSKNQVRQRILQRARDVLMHALSHPDCERVTLIGHSLGSAIALDTLSRLGREVRAELDTMQGQERMKQADSLVQRLQKLTAFITYGSPVDKIYYFFETQRLPLREYNNLVERQRGDLRFEPFNTELFKTGITWLNLFDHSDPVSSEIYSFAPANAVEPFVRNVEVASHNLPFPDSHGAYIDNKTAMELIYNLTFAQVLPPAIPLSADASLKARRAMVQVFYILSLTVGLLPVMTWIPSGIGDGFLIASVVLLLGLLLVTWWYGRRKRDRY